jgi:hypothetical protein
MIESLEDRGERESPSQSLTTPQSPPITKSLNPSPTPSYPPCLLVPPPLITYNLGTNLAPVLYISLYTSPYTSIPVGPLSLFPLVSKSSAITS